MLKVSPMCDSATISLHRDPSGTPDPLDVFSPYNPSSRRPSAQHRAYLSVSVSDPSTIISVRPALPVACTAASQNRLRPIKIDSVMKSEHAS